MPTEISYAGGTATVLTYDGEGNRVKKEGSSETVIYVGDIYEIRGEEVLSHVYANGKKIVTLTDDNEYYAHPDHLGSTSMVTDENGNAVEEIGYLPFGAQLFRKVYNNGEWVSAYKFTGQEHDSEYELYNYNARLYDPIMGRFITPDSIIPDPYNPQSLNRYAYCLNNPLIYTDPSGNESFTLDEITVTAPGQSGSLTIDITISDIPSEMSSDIPSTTEEMDKFWGRRYSDSNPVINQPSDGNVITKKTQYSNEVIGAAGKGWGKMKRWKSIRIIKDYTLKFKIYKNLQTSNASRVVINGQMIGKAAGYLNVYLSYRNFKNGYLDDGNTFGYHAQVATGRAIFGFIGAEFGVELFGCAGFALTSQSCGWGAIPLAIGGGLIVGEGGADFGESLVNSIYENIINK